MDDKKEKIQQEVEDLLKKLGVEAELEVSVEESAFKVQINTPGDAPHLIGRHGEMLQSLQRILEAIFFKMFGEPVSLIVNVNDYRERQTERLQGIAQDAAQRVRTEGTEQYLRSFSPYERKIIHEYVAAEFPDLTSRSEGEGRDRVLIVSAKQEEEK